MSIKTDKFEAKHPSGALLRIEGAVIDDAGFAVRVKCPDGELTGYRFAPLPTTATAYRTDAQNHEELLRVAFDTFYDYLCVKKRLSLCEEILRNCARPEEENLSQDCIANWDTTGLNLQCYVAKTRRALAEQRLLARLRMRRLPKLDLDTFRHYVEMARKAPNEKEDE